MFKYLVVFILFFSVNSFAQTSRTVTKLDEKTIVKDVDGNVLPHAIWTKLMQTGVYNLRKAEGADEFVAYQMNETEKARAAERKKKQLETMPKPRPSDSFKEGDKFKGDRFTDMNGNKYDLRALTGKVLVFNFWFINCPPCKQEIPELNRVYNQYKDNKDVEFLAIALDEKYDLKEFLKTSPFLYNIIPSGNYYSQKYSVNSYPTHVVVGKDGLIKFSTVGLASNTVHWVEKTIKEQSAIN